MRGVLDITLCDKSLSGTCGRAGWWFSPGTLVSSINETDRHDVTEILLTVGLNTITLALTYELENDLTYYDIIPFLQPLE